MQSRIRGGETWGTPVRGAICRLFLTTKTPPVLAARTSKCFFCDRTQGQFRRAEQASKEGQISSRTIATLVSCRTGEPARDKPPSEEFTARRKPLGTPSRRYLGNKASGSLRGMPKKESARGGIEQRCRLSEEEKKRTRREKRRLLSTRRQEASDDEAAAAPGRPGGRGGVRPCAAPRRARDALHSPHLPAPVSPRLSRPAFQGQRRDVCSLIRSLGRW